MQQLSILITLLLAQCCFAGLYPYCQTSQQPINVLFITGSESYTYPMSKLFTGNSLVYDVETSYNTYIAQPYTSLSSTSASFINIVSYDIWRNNDGSATHAIIDQYASNYKLYFGRSNAQSAPSWNTGTNLTIPNIKKCFSVVFLNNQTVALDCYQSDKGLTNVMYIVNMNNPQFTPQSFQNWPSGLSEVYSRRFSKLFFSSITQNTSSDVLNNNIQQGNQNVFLFSGIIENDPFKVTPIPDLFYVYYYDATPTGFYPNGQLISKPLLTCQDFNLTDCKLKDFDITANQVFALTQEKLFGYKAIGFNYQLPTKISGIRQITVLEQGLRIAAIQRGRQFTVAVMSDKTVYEYTWDNNEDPKQASNQYYLSILPSDSSQIILSYNFLTLINNNTAYFYERTPDNSGFIPSLLSWEIVNNQYSMNVLVFDTDDIFFAYPNQFEAGLLRKPYIILKGDSIARNTTVRLQATSSILDSPNLPTQTCQFTITVQGFTIPEVGTFSSIIAPDIQYQTFDGMNQSFPIDAKFMGPDLKYTVKEKGKYEYNIPIDTKAYYPQLNETQFVFEAAWQNPHQEGIFYQFYQGRSFFLYIFTCRQASTDTTFTCASSATITSFEAPLTSFSAFLNSNDTIPLFLVSVTNDIRAYFFTLDGTIVGTQTIGGVGPISSVTVGGYLAFFVQSAQNYVTACKLVIPDNFSNFTGLPCLWTLDQTNTANWPGMQDTPFEPLNTYMNENNPNLVYIELNDRITIIDINNNLPVYISTILLQGKAKDQTWLRNIYAAQASIFVIESQSSGTGQQFITEFETINPYSTYIQKILPFYGYKLSTPLSSSFSKNTNILYVTAETATEKAILCYRSGMPVVNTLYFIGKVSANSTANFIVLAGGINNTADYVTAWRGSQNFAFYLPKVPTLITNITIQHPQSYIASENYTLQITSSLDAQKKVATTQLFLVVANTQTRVKVDEKAVHSEFDFNVPTLKTKNYSYFSDENWIEGSHLGYTLIDGKQKFNFTGHFTKGASNINGFQQVNELFVAPASAFSGLGPVIIFQTQNNSVYSMNENFTLLGQLETIVDPTQAVCFSMIPVYSSNGMLASTISVCVDITFTWYVVTVSWTDGVPVSTKGKMKLSGISIQNQFPVIKYYNGFFYFMDSPRNPQPGNTGSVNVYSLNFVSNNATLVTKFDAGVFNYPTLSLIAFSLIPTSQSGVSQYFVLDCYGRQLFFGTYDDTFSNPNNSLISKGSLAIKDFILNSTNGFILPNTKFVNLVYLQTSKNSQKPDLTYYSVLVVPSNTAFYEITLGCDSSGLCKDNNISRIFNNYGPNMVLVNRFQFVQNFMLVPFFNEEYGIEVIAFYNSTSTSFMNTMFAGAVASELSVFSEVFAPYIDTNGRINLMYDNLLGGQLSQTIYNPQLFLNATNTDFILEELIFVIDSLYPQTTVLHLQVTNYRCDGIWNIIHYDVCHRKRSTKLSQRNQYQNIIETAQFQNKTQTAVMF